MTPRRRSILVALFAVFAVVSATLAVGPAAATPPSGFRALAGDRAAAFELPGDVELVRTLDLTTYGLRYERYQQRFGAAAVLGGQLTVYRDADGTQVLVVGAHYPDIQPSNDVALTPAAARRVVDDDIGVAGERRVDLLIDPADGTFFYRVETRRFATRWFHWIDAQSGRIRNRFDAAAEDHGIGVKGDTKSTSGITTFHASSGHGASGAHHDLIAPDGRQATYDARNRTSLLYYVTDADDHWTTTGRTSAGHPALVDAQYHANLTDDYFLGVHGTNWLSCYPSGMQSVGHYSRNYNNAFWNGTYTVYGDGDGSVFRELSGGFDVVAHEHTHGVTDCTSALIYQNESGALNEAFSDVLGNSAEFFAAEPTTTNCVRAAGQADCADWWIGEDVYLPSDTVPGFRNMADPREDGDPDHYSERQLGGDDNGGVHSNSGIPNHAYYLLVNGGQNAGCDFTGSGGHHHDADCDVTVAGVGLAAAQEIFFLGFIGLPENASMCHARGATVAAATTADRQASTRQAWEAVGVTGSLCGDVPPVNHAPNATGDDAVTTVDTAVTVDVLANDTDPDGDALSVVPATLGPPNAGTVVLNGDGTVTYTPDPGFVGTDTFLYEATDGELTDDAIVTVTVLEAAATMHVADLTGSSTSQGRTWTASVTVTIVDSVGNPVSGASVSGHWNAEAAGSAVCSAPTDAEGRCTVSRSGIPKRQGGITFTVDDVTHATLAYAPSENVETSIQVTK